MTVALNRAGGGLAVLAGVTRLELAVVLLGRVIGGAIGATGAGGRADLEEAGVSRDWINLVGFVAARIVGTGEN